MEEPQLTEQQSLQIITEMIQKAKGNFHTSGTSAILWGSVVTIAGVVSFIERQWNVSIGFDIWLIVLAAIIPQIFITIREKRKRQIVTHSEAFINAIWLVYGIGIFALVFYLNMVPAITEKILAGQHQQVMIKDLATGQLQPLRIFIPSGASLLIILYGIPTLTTGIATKFRPMLIGGIICYIYFLISCFTTTSYDFLLNGLAAITNWLIPGLILRYRKLKADRS